MHSSPFNPPRPSRRPRPLGPWALAAGLLLGSAGAARAVTPADLASGLGGAIGIAFDSLHNRLYFVEFNSGNLKWIQLTPECEAATPPSCDAGTVPGGTFTHPEDIALDVAHGVGYLTTRDDVGTTGSLWRVDLATGAKSLVTFNLGAPQQIALDAATNTAYVVGYDAGRVWRIDLTTGVKHTALAGLGHPVGVVIKADRTRAYVSQQDAPGRVSELDLATGALLRDVATGLSAPFFLAFTDAAESALYLPEREPIQRLSRIDLVTATRVEIAVDAPGLAARPSAVVASALTGAAYATTESRVVRLPLFALPPDAPVFIAVGRVPSTDIHEGYATTNTAGFAVTDAPFGGTLDLLGNLSRFRSLGATHYRVLISTAGPLGPFTPLVQSWQAGHWNPSTFHYDPTLVTPVGGDRYPLPDDLILWSPVALMMRWPSSGNGLVDFQVDLWKPYDPITCGVLLPPGSAWCPVGLPPMGNSLSLLIDNTPPEVDLVALRQHGAPLPLAVCEIVHGGNKRLDFQITAHDPNHHLAGYSVTAYFGHNGSEAVLGESYATHHEEGGRLWSGVTNTWHEPPWMVDCRCAHTFFLSAVKRTIDGYNQILDGHSNQSLTFDFPDLATCP